MGSVTESESSDLGTFKGVQVWVSEKSNDLFLFAATDDGVVVFTGGVVGANATVMCFSFDGDADECCGDCFCSFTV